MSIMIWFWGCFVHVCACFETNIVLFGIITWHIIILTVVFLSIYGASVTGDTDKPIMYMDLRPCVFTFMEWHREILGNIWVIYDIGYFAVTCGKPWIKCMQRPIRAMSYIISPVNFFLWSADCYQTRKNSQKLYHWLSVHIIRLTRSSPH